MKPYKVTETRQVTYMAHSPGEAEIRECAANEANHQGHELLSVDVSEIIDVESWEGTVQQLSLFGAEQAWEDSEANKLRPVTRTYSDIREVTT